MSYFNENKVKTISSEEETMKLRSSLELAEKGWKQALQLLQQMKQSMDTLNPSSVPGQTFSSMDQSSYSQDISTIYGTPMGKVNHTSTSLPWISHSISYQPNVQKSHVNQYILQIESVRYDNERLLRQYYTQEKKYQESLMEIEKQAKAMKLMCMQFYEQIQSVHSSYVSHVASDPSISEVDSNNNNSTFEADSLVSGSCVWDRDDNNNMNKTKNRICGDIESSIRRIKAINNESLMQALTFSVNRSKPDDSFHPLATWNLNNLNPNPNVRDDTRRLSDELFLRSPLAKERKIEGNYNRSLSPKRNKTTSPTSSPLPSPRPFKQSPLSSSPSSRLQSLSSSPSSKGSKGSKELTLSLPKKGNNSPKSSPLPSPRPRSSSSSPLSSSSSPSNSISRGIKAMPSPLKIRNNTQSPHDQSPSIRTIGSNSPTSKNDNDHDNQSDSDSNAYMSNESKLILKKSSILHHPSDTISVNSNTLFDSDMDSDSLQAQVIHLKQLLKNSSNSTSLFYPTSTDNTINPINTTISNPRRNNSPIRPNEDVKSIPKETGNSSSDDSVENNRMSESYVRRTEDSYNDANDSNIKVFDQIKPKRKKSKQQVMKPSLKHSPIRYIVSHNSLSKPKYSSSNNTNISHNLTSSHISDLPTPMNEDSPTWRYPPRLSLAQRNSKAFMSQLTNLIDKTAKITNVAQIPMTENRVYSIKGYMDRHRNRHNNDDMDNNRIEKIKPMTRLRRTRNNSDSDV